MLNAASSPPFMTARRIVVVREAGALTAADAEAIGRYLDAPLDTSVDRARQRRRHDPRRAHEEAEGGRRGRAGPDSEKTSRRPRQARRGHANVQLRPTRSSSSPRTSARTPAASARSSTCCARPTATARRSTPTTSRRTSAKPAPCPSFQLTNAIEEGDSAGALEVLAPLAQCTERARMPRPMHPLQVLSTLLGYYRRLLRLDDASVHSTRRRDRRARRSGQGVPGAQGARRGALARHRRHPPGVRRRCTRPTSTSRRARHPGGRGDRGAGRAPGSPLTGEWSRQREGAAGRATPVGAIPRCRGGVRPLHQARGAAGGLVLVDPALRRGHAEALLRGADRLRRVLGRRCRSPHGRA